MFRVLLTDMEAGKVKNLFKSLLNMPEFAIKALVTG